ncbi:copper resistance protein CopC [Acinetobacter sp. CUI P1]|nr:copper resistance protein CopC [Acinetobacter sp. CUI P1]
MRKVMLLILLLLVLLPTMVSAHTELESSYPKENEIITQPITEIILTFNTDLEKLSTLTLLDQNGQKIVLNTVVVEGNILKATLKSVLTNGDYTVNWKIVGKDGHVITRNYSFSVNIPEIPQEGEKIAPSPIPDAQSDVGKTNVELPPIKAESVSSRFNLMNVVWTGAGFLILVGVLYMVWRKRK